LSFVTQEEPTEGQPENAVIRTDPAPGVDVSEGTSITLFYNPPKGPVPIPEEVKGKTVDEATAILIGAGFTVAKDLQGVESELPPGTVVATSPPIGTPTKLGTEVTLTISKAPDQVSVPGVADLSSADAKATLEAEPLLFKVTVVTEPSADVPAGAAIRTDPAVNTPVPKGSAITLVVSEGPAKVRVPVVDGLPEAEARNELVKAGLIADVRIVLVAADSPDVGHVISQSLPGTEKVAPGTTIVIKVGKAAPPPATTVPTTVPVTTPATTSSTTTTTSTPSSTTSTTV
jgi:serine/threonine-protein kinase